MANSWKTILICALFCLCLYRRVALAQKAQPRIVGGSTTNIRNAPYLVNLRYNGVFYCGGSLVTRNHVVTAAHCVKGKNRNSITVIGGSTSLSNGGVTRRVSRAFIPNNFSLATKNMDVAVLKLASPMNGSNIGTIGLCNANLRAGNQVRVYGWGFTSEGGRAASDNLRSVTVPLVAKARCSQQYRGKAALTRSMFCASVPGRRDSCAGDSGGPAVFNGRLCGIVSFGVGCARTRYPGVYTNVRTVTSFIQRAIQQ